MSQSSDQLIKAIEDGDLAAVQHLLARGVSPSSRANAVPALMFAVHYGREDICAALLTAGADPDAVSEKGITSLMMAVEMGQLSCARLLLKSGADVNRTDSDGNSAMMFARGQRHVALVDLLQSYRAQETIHCPWCSYRGVSVPPFPGVAACPGCQVEFCLIKGYPPQCAACRGPIVPAPKDDFDYRLAATVPAYKGRIPGICKRCGFRFMLHPGRERGGT